MEEKRGKSQVSSQQIRNKNNVEKNIHTESSYAYFPILFHICIFASRRVVRFGVFSLILLFFFERYSQFVVSAASVVEILDTEI